MTTAKTSIRNSLISGGIAMACLGFILHDAFKWTANSTLVGAFCPVNESVWEHLKMAYLAILIYSIFEYPILKNSTSNYFLSKCIGLICFEITILIIHYGALSANAHGMLWIDILSYFAGIFSCQWVCMILWRSRPWNKWPDAWNILFYFMAGLLFVYFTFSPPQLEIFKDSKSQTYGIYKLK